MQQPTALPSTRPHASTDSLFTPGGSPWIPAPVKRPSNGEALRVFLEILFLARKGVTTKIIDNELAARLRITTRSLQRYLRILENEGFIRRERKHGGRIIHILTRFAGKHRSDRPVGTDSTTVASPPGPPDKDAIKNDEQTGESPSFSSLDRQSGPSSREALACPETNSPAAPPVDPACFPDRDSKPPKTPGRPIQAAELDAAVLAVLTAKAIATMECDHAKAEAEIKHAARRVSPWEMDQAFDASARKKVKDGSVGWGHWINTLAGYQKTGGPKPTISPDQAKRFREAKEALKQVALLGRKLVVIGEFLKIEQRDPDNANSQYFPAWLKRDLEKHRPEVISILRGV